MIGDLFDSPWKILIVAVVIIVLFGSRKLPDAARSLGRSMRILKKEVSSMNEDEDTTSSVAPVQLQGTQLQGTEQAPVNTQAQIASLQAQLNNLQKESATDSETPATADSQQAR
jgi:sec-independent protein translocase protein TatA